MDMQVVHGLACVAAGVHDQPIAALGDAFPLRDLRGFPTIASSAPLRSDTDATCLRDRIKMWVGAWGEMSRIAKIESSE